MAANNPIKHHYIPRFLMRPFSAEGMQVSYFDKEKKTVKTRDIGDVFMERNLYRDETHHSDDPTQIEKDLAVFECEVAPILNRFVNNDDIEISAEEEEKLKVFFFIMGFRGEHVKRAFSTDIKEQNVRYYGKFLRDEDYIDFWRRNLGEIVKCRTIAEIMSSKAIDQPMKIFAQRDMIGVLPAYTYFTVIQSDGDFILGDGYPTEVTGDNDFGMNVPLFSIFPISPDRAILQCHYGVIYTPRSVLGLSKKEFLREIVVPAGSKSKPIPIRNVAPEDVKMINRMVFNAAEEGIVFQNKTAAIDELMSEII